MIITRALCVVVFVCRTEAVQACDTDQNERVFLFYALEIREKLKILSGCGLSVKLSNSKRYRGSARIQPNKCVIERQALGQRKSGFAGDVATGFGVRIPPPAPGADPSYRYFVHIVCEWLMNLHDLGRHKFLCELLNETNERFCPFVLRLSSSDPAFNAQLFDSYCNWFRLMRLGVAVLVEVKDSRSYVK